MEYNVLNSDLGIFSLAPSAVVAASPTASNLVIIILKRGHIVFPFPLENDGD